MTQYFTPNDVNAILPELNELLQDVLERRARIVRQLERGDVDDVTAQNETGSAAASKMAYEFGMVEDLVDQIRSYGCEIKDLNSGLIDFLARRRGRDVYICWRYGEPLHATWYHELHTGFHGRKAIRSSDFEQR